MSDRRARDVIVTGIPRSGTTLTAALIDSLPDAVCLNEPAWQVEKKMDSPQAFAQWVAEDFVQVRQKLLRGDPVSDRRSPEGLAVTNYYRPDANNRDMEHTYRIVPFTRPGLTGDFTLGVKHNSPYMAVLEQLIDLGCFTVIAIIRHPVEVIASWRSLALPVSRGRLPNAEPYWPQMAQLTRAPMDLLEKQVRIYDLLCDKIYRLREHIHVLPYEELIQNPNRLCEYTGITGDLADRVATGDKKAVPAAVQERIAQALKKYGNDYARFYPEI